MKKGKVKELLQDLEDRIIDKMNHRELDEYLDNANGILDNSFVDRIRDEIESIKQNTSLEFDKVFDEL